MSNYTCDKAVSVPIYFNDYVEMTGPSSLRYKLEKIMVCSSLKLALNQSFSYCVANATQNSHWSKSIACQSNLIRCNYAINNFQTECRFYK
jgi:hypothetical protein